MKYPTNREKLISLLSPLAEGRELKYAQLYHLHLCSWSPLAEGRELKCSIAGTDGVYDMSPLAEGRELKSLKRYILISAKDVAPRGGA